MVQARVLLYFRDMIKVEDNFTHGFAREDAERVISGVGRAIFKIGVPRSIINEGVDRSGYWFLLALSELEPLRLSALAEEMTLDISTVSRHAKDLLDLGFIDKLDDPHDKRAQLLKLSKKGKDTLRKISKDRSEKILNALSDWNDSDVDELLNLLSRLADGFLKVDSTLHCPGLKSVKNSLAKETL